MLLWNQSYGFDVSYLWRIFIIAQNLQIHGASIKRINKATPTTSDQKVIYPLLLKKQFCLFINAFASLRCWRNAFMAKPKTLANPLTEWFGILSPKPPISDYMCYLLVALMPLPTLIMVKKFYVRIFMQFNYFFWHFIIPIGVPFNNGLSVCNEVLYRWSRRFFLLPKAKMKACFYFRLFLRVFITKFYKHLYHCLNFYNMSLKDKIWHKN